MGKSRKVTYELRTTSTAKKSPHIQSCAQEKEEFLSWAVKGLSVFCAISPCVSLLDIANFWAHQSRASIVCRNCSTGQASGKSANALLRSIFNEIRYALDRGEESLARALILSEACFTAYFLNSTNDVVKFLESFNSWPDLNKDDLDKLKNSNMLKNIFQGTNTCMSFSQNIEAVKTRVGMVRYLLLPPWLLQSNEERLHSSLEIVEINFKEKGVGTNHIVRLRSGHSFRTLSVLLAHAIKVESQFIRITHNDRPLFFSANANRKIEDLGITDACTMTYFNAQSLRAASQDAKSDSPGNSSRKESKSKKAGGGAKAKTQKKRNSNVQPNYISSATQEKAKERHSKLLSSLFEEAEPKFREIRKILNDLTIQKANKNSSTKKRTTSKVQLVENNPSNVGIGHSPGQVMYPIVVGNVNDLYKSSKRSSRRHSQPKDGKRRLSIDLHGKSKNEALKALNESLPRWIDSAMKGEHPFVEVVDIITGGGKQILSEVVEGWIKSNTHVTNRPKSFW